MYSVCIPILLYMIIKYLNFTIYTDQHIPINNLTNIIFFLYQIAI